MTLSTALPLQITNNEILVNDIIKLLEIDDAKSHIDEEVWREFLNIYSQRFNKTDKFIEGQISMYKLTKQRFPDVREWALAPVEHKILGGVRAIISNVLYYYVSVLSRRIPVDWKILNGYYEMPETLYKKDIQKIKEVSNQLKYADVTMRNVKYFIQKLMIATGKAFNEITDEDIYDYRNCFAKPAFAKPTFVVLKHIGTIHELSSYKINNIGNYKNDNGVTFLNENNEIINVYNQFNKSAEITMVSNTKNNKIRAIKYFLNWLWEYDRNLKDFKDLNYQKHMEGFARYIKTNSRPGIGKPYTAKSAVSILSDLKAFLSYLDKNNKLNEQLTCDLAQYNSLYTKNYMFSSLPEPIPADDRSEIERIVLHETYSSNPMVMPMLKILYHLGLRPIEMMALKLECRKGNKEVPQLHVHKAKNYNKRTLPLIPDVLEIIRTLEKININSKPVYLEYDGLTCKRLFSYRDELMLVGSLNDIFQELLLKGSNNKLAGPNGKCRYSLYDLRRIRITTWLESGMPEVEVAYLAGHEDVDTHNYYIIAKESRLKNAKAAFSTFYEDVMNQLKTTGAYIPVTKEEEADENSKYVSRLEKMLLEIENKNINTFALEQAANSYPELAMPVPCGNCLANAIIGQEYECEKARLACLECNELIINENSLKEFDKYVGRIYAARHQYARTHYDGLVARTDELIQRLNRFYMTKLGLSEKDVIGKFELIERSCTPKRGRKKNVAV